MSDAADIRPRLSYREGGWLVLAVALHALLLLIPQAEERPRAIVERAKLAIRLMPLSAPPARELPRESVAEAVHPAPIPRRLPASPAATLPAPEPALPMGPPQEIAEDDLGVSAARLIDLRDSVTERVPLEKSAETPRLRLGSPKPFERRGNWQSGTGADALAPFDNAFNGKTVPAEVEIVDRWLAADGSQNVIVETPAGLRLCGRAPPWDPAQPLVEHVMRWQVCGGDFARPFKYKPREPLDRNFIIPVVKAATEP